MENEKLNMYEAGKPEHCWKCAEKITTPSFISVDNRSFHVTCFRCKKCGALLDTINYCIRTRDPYCLTHDLHELENECSHSGEDNTLEVVREIRDVKENPSCTKCKNTLTCLTFKMLGGNPYCSICSPTFSCGSHFSVDSGSSIDMRSFHTEKASDVCEKGYPSLCKLYNVTDSPICTVEREQFYSKPYDLKLTTRDWESRKPELHRISPKPYSADHSPVIREQKKRRSISESNSRCASMHDLCYTIKSDASRSQSMHSVRPSVQVIRSNENPTVFTANRSFSPHERTIVLSSRSSPTRLTSPRQYASDNNFIRRSILRKSNSYSSLGSNNIGRRSNRLSWAKSNEAMAVDNRLSRLFIGYQCNECSSLIPPNQLQRCGSGYYHERCAKCITRKIPASQQQVVDNSKNFFCQRHVSRGEVLEPYKGTLRTSTNLICKNPGIVPMVRSTRRVLVPKSKYNSSIRKVSSRQNQYYPRYQVLAN